MSKYCNNASPLTSRISGKHNTTWKRLIRVRAQAQPHIRWVVGQGKIFFWDDIWLGKSALRDLALNDRGCPNALVGDFIWEGTWDKPKIWLLHARAGLPQRATEQILDTPIVDGGPDIPWWNLSRFGDFSLATTWETIRTQRPIIRGLDDIWKACLTTSISIFIWRLLSNRIPVDTKLQWRKMELASKCEYCPHRPGSNQCMERIRSLVRRIFPPLQINDTIPDRLGV
ncbi:uncharacterized protein LOC121784252 [Salvia splendens]|uniref:uncharacterized protein LOC121784252 n=1 Tax=Salvia splendens TaxID=180675 RepID=UPI001C255AAF|nr:uncharacterized protein LOC121784252 [Salvia splendens]